MQMMEDQNRPKGMSPDEICIHQAENEFSLSEGEKRKEKVDICTVKNENL